MTIESGAQADTFAPITLAAIQGSFIAGPREWAARPSLHYWISFTELLMFDTSNEANLLKYGWQTSATPTITMTTGLGDGNFLDDTVGLGANFLSLTGSGDIVTSPSVFGGIEANNFLFNTLRFKPRRLMMECVAAFPVDPTSGTDPAVGFGQTAHIQRGPDNFEISNSTTETSMGTSDSDPHIWRIRVEDAVYASIDGGSEVSVALETGKWPERFAFQCGTGNGEIDIAWAHIWYE